MTAPRTAVANYSRLRQHRWTLVPMPVVEADLLPDHCLIDGRYLATKGKRLGDMTQMWHVHIDLEGHASGPLVEWKPFPADARFPAFQLTDWVTDDVEAMKLHLIIDEIGRPLIKLPLAFVRVEEQSAAQRIWRLEAHAAGWHATCYATLWSGQDVIDLALRVVWSDISGARPTIRTGKTRITLESGGEPIASWAGNLRGQRNIGPKTIRLYDDVTAHGYPIEWRGVMGAMPKGGTAGADERRMANVWAAHDGPIMGAAVFGSHWMAWGAPDVDVPAGSLQAQWLAYAAETHGYHDQRPLALDIVAGRTGSQEPFGATKDAVAAGGRPWRMGMLMHGADDPRALFHLDSDGQPVTRVGKPGFQSWEQLIELRVSPDTIGKDRAQLPGWDMLGARRIAEDDQHRGNGYRIAAYAMTGDLLLRDRMMAELAVDECRAFPARWKASDPTSYLDAPRATGRLMQGWARMMLLLVGHDQARERLFGLGVNELDMWEQALPTTGVVRPAFTLVDNRVLPGGVTASMPWQDALLCLGLLEFADSARMCGLTSNADRAERMAVAIGRNVVQWGFVRSSWGQLLPITGLLIDADGSAQPSAYYTFPRAGASDAPVAGTDMMVGGAGWVAWYSGAIKAALRGDHDAVHTRAVELVAAYAGGVGVNWREWWHVR